MDTHGIFQAVILVTIFILRVYVTCSLFFKIWLAESILISREELFRGTWFLLASNTLRHKFFPMKISSLHWNGAAYTCKEKLWRKVADEYQMSWSPFFHRRGDSEEGVSLKRDEYYIYMAQLSFQSLYKTLLLKKVLCPIFLDDISRFVSSWWKRPTQKRFFFSIFPLNNFPLEAPGLCTTWRIKRTNFH